jgi:U5 snRNP spliceosome subunit
MTEQPPGPEFVPPGHTPEPPAQPAGSDGPGPVGPGYPSVGPQPGQPGIGAQSGYSGYPPGATPGYVPGPPPGYPPPGASRPKGGRGSILLGIAITYISLAAAWFSLMSAFSSSPLSGLLSSLSAMLPLALIVVGIVLAVLPKTTRTGAGILIGIGSAILIAGGLCVALLVGFGQ